MEIPYQEALKHPFFIQTISLEKFAAYKQRAFMVSERLPSPVNPSDYHPLLVFHVGFNDIATRQLLTVKRDSMSLGAMLKGSGAQVVFSSILPVRGRGSGRRRQIEQVNAWLSSWCQIQGFVFYD